MQRIKVMWLAVIMAVFSTQANMVVNGDFSSGTLNSASSIKLDPDAYTPDAIDNGWYQNLQQYVVTNGAVLRDQTTATYTGQRYGLGQVMTSPADLVSGESMRLSFSQSVTDSDNDCHFGVYVYGYVLRSTATAWLSNNGDYLPLRDAQSCGDETGNGNYDRYLLLATEFSNGASDYSTDITLTRDYDYFGVVFQGAVPDASDSWTIDNVVMGESKQDQTISFPNPGNQITTNTVTLSATASSGLPVTYEVVSGSASISGGSNVTLTGSGSVTLSANQSGDSSWNSALQTNVTFTVTQASATVNLSNLSQVYDGTQKPVTVSTVPTGLSVSVTYDGSATVPSAVGSYAVAATVNDAMYQGTASGTLEITAAVGNMIVNGGFGSAIYKSDAATLMIPNGLVDVGWCQNGVQFGVNSGSAVRTKAISTSDFQFTGIGQVVTADAGLGSGDTMTLSFSQSVADADGDCSFGIYVYGYINTNPNDATWTANTANGDFLPLRDAQTYGDATGAGNYDRYILCSKIFADGSPDFSTNIVLTRNYDHYGIVFQGKVPDDSDSWTIDDVVLGGAGSSGGGSGGTGPVTNECLAGWYEIANASGKWNEGVTTAGAFRSPAVMRIGKEYKSPVNYFTANVIAYELPDLKGASIASASFKCYVTGWSIASGGANIDLVGLRATDAPSPILAASDFTAVGTPAGTSIQNDLIPYTTSDLTGWYETSAAANSTLAGWLQAQYDAYGPGAYVFLRLAPDAALPDGESNYASISRSLATNAMPTLTIITDGNITEADSGTNSQVSVQMGHNKFTWTFDKAVQWGRFVDGQPWIVRPSSGVSLTAVSPAPARADVYLPNTSILVQNAAINQTVINPPVGSFYTNNATPADLSDDWFYSPGKSSLPGAFGWDGRVIADDDNFPKSNTNLAWNGSSRALAVGDSVVSAKSYTDGQNNKDRAVMLEAAAVLTVLDSAPPADAFRPGVIRTGTERTNPTIVTLSDLRTDITPILSPVGYPDLKGNTLTVLDEEYSFNCVRGLLPGPAIVNEGNTSRIEGCAALYNNSVYHGQIGSAGNYGAKLAMRYGYLAIGALADWFTPEQRRVCQIRFIQRAIDYYSAVASGVTLQVDCGHAPGYSTMITVAGGMLKTNCPLRDKMLKVNEGILVGATPVPPWFIFADYGMNYHNGLTGTNLVSGDVLDEIPEDRQILRTSTLPVYNVANMACVQSSTSNTFTAPLTTNDWPTIRPMFDMINLKFRITSGAGASSNVYVIVNTVKTNFYLYDQASNTYSQYISGVTAKYDHGGTFMVKPPFTNGQPDSTSRLTFSVLTDKDPVGWYMTESSQAFRDDYGVHPYEDDLAMTTFTMSADPGAYVSNHGGANIDLLIAMYYLDLEGYYKGGMDKYLIYSSGTSGMGEYLFGAATYMDMTDRQVARGALWERDVLEKKGVIFSYTDGKTDNIQAVPAGAKLWCDP